ncbi:hypothetical protein WA158_005920 [Blastocystis sp. Blastoise]
MKNDFLQLYLYKKEDCKELWRDCSVSINYEDILLITNPNCSSETNNLLIHLYDILFQKVFPEEYEAEKVAHELIKDSSVLKNKDSDKEKHINSAENEYTKDDIHENLWQSISKDSSLLSDSSEILYSNTTYREPEINDVKEFYQFIHKEIRELSPILFNHLLCPPDSRGFLDDSIMEIENNHKWIYKQWTIIPPNIPKIPSACIIEDPNYRLNKKYKNENHAFLKYLNQNGEHDWNSVPFVCYVQLYGFPFKCILGNVSNFSISNSILFEDKEIPLLSQLLPRENDHVENVIPHYFRPEKQNTNSFTESEYKQIALIMNNYSYIYTSFFTLTTFIHSHGLSIRQLGNIIPYLSNENCDMIYMYLYARAVKNILLDKIRTYIYHMYSDINKNNYIKSKEDIDNYLTTCLSGIVSLCNSYMHVILGDPLDVLQLEILPVLFILYPSLYPATIHIGLSPAFYIYIWNWLQISVPNNNINNNNNKQFFFSDPSTITCIPSIPLLTADIISRAFFSIHFALIKNIQKTIVSLSTASYKSIYITILLFPSLSFYIYTSLFFFYHSRIPRDYLESTFLAVAGSLPPSSPALSQLFEYYFYLQDSQQNIQSLQIRQIQSWLNIHFSHISITRETTIALLLCDIYIYSSPLTSLTLCLYIYKQYYNIIYKNNNKNIILLKSLIPVFIRLGILYCIFTNYNESLHYFRISFSYLPSISELPAISISLSLYIQACYIYTIVLIHFRYFHQALKIIQYTFCAFQYFHIHSSYSLYFPCLYLYAYVYYNLHLYTQCLDLLERIRYEIPKENNEIIRDLVRIMMFIFMDSIISQNKVPKQFINDTNYNSSTININTIIDIIIEKDSVTEYLYKMQRNSTDSEISIFQTIYQWHKQFLNK